jgi:hypothetical protein
MPSVAKLQAIVEHLGGSVLEMTVAPRDPDIDVVDLVVYDPHDRLDLQSGDLLVGVGVPPGPAATGLVAQLGAAGGVGLLLKSDTPPGADLVAACRGAGVALLSVPREAGWAQVLSLVRSLLTEDVLVRDEVPSASEEMAGVAAGDLFALADAIAELMDSPVIIEDPQFRVLAYSSRQEEVDWGRSETILGRRVPERFLQQLHDSGIVRQVMTKREPIVIQEMFPGMKPRLVIAVRAGTAVLGTMTVVYDRPSPEKEKLFADCANLVALQMLRQRLSADAEVRLRVELLGALLEGVPGVHDAADRLGLLDDGYRVLAAYICAPGNPSEVESWRAQLWDAVSLYTNVVHLRAASAPLGDAVYVVMAAGPDAEASRVKAARIAEDFLARSAPRLPVRTVVGIGGHAALTDIPRSRQEADQVVRVLRSESAGPTVAEIDDVSVKVMLMRLRDVAGAQPRLRERRLAKLVAHDARRGTQYLETLRIYLDAFGEVGRTSGLLGVHANTLRHRLGRIREISGIELDDPEVRLGVMLELRLFPTGVDEAVAHEAPSP